MLPSPVVPTAPTLLRDAGSLPKRAASWDGAMTVNALSVNGQRSMSLPFSLGSRLPCSPSVSIDSTAVFGLPYTPKDINGGAQYIAAVEGDGGSRTVPAQSGSIVAALPHPGRDSSADLDFLSGGLLGAAPTAADFKPCSDSKPRSDAAACQTAAITGSTWARQARKSVKTEAHACVTVLFTDIVGFSAFNNEVRPDNSSTLPCFLAAIAKTMLYLRPSSKPKRIPANCSIASESAPPHLLQYESLLATS